jgi:hypothetical protein
MFWARWRSWLVRRWATRSRSVAYVSPLPFDSDEFARLISSRDPADLKRLATGLARPVAVRPSTR